jgi:hypothetical protein
MVFRKKKLYDDDELLEIGAQPTPIKKATLPTSPAQSNPYIRGGYSVDDEINNMIIKASRQDPDAVSFYDTEDIKIKNKEKQDITDTEAIRRSVHTISNYYNTLGVFRDDFDKVSNDKLARNSYYAMCEKALMDYMGSIEYKVVDSNGESVEKATDFLDAPNPQDTFDVLLKMAIRDLIRYDAGVWVKSFNRGGYLTEIKAYLGTEFWKEIDRVPMSIGIPRDYLTSGANMYQGWWSHGYTERYWQRSRTGVYIPFQPEEVCYFMSYPRTDGVYGTDFVKFLKHQLQYLIDSTRAAGKTFENGIVPSMVWEHPDVMTREQLMQRIKKVEVENRGSYKFGGIIHTVNNEKVTTLAQRLHDMEWLEGQKFVAQLIWSMWGFSPSEFIGEGENRATAYVKRNITKSRLLYPLMKHFALKINREILPYLKGYREGWHFEFIRDVDLDDEQKVAQTQAIKITSFNTLVSMGVKPSVALRVSSLDDGLTKPEIEELDESLEMMNQGLEGELATTEGGLNEDNEAGRYGNGSESYVDASIGSDEGSKGTEAPRDAAEEEKQFKKALEGGQVEFFREGVIEKAKVYINYPSEAPPGRHVGRGARGGYYYITNVRTPGHAAQSGKQEGAAVGKRRRKKGWGGGGGSPEKQVSTPPPPDIAKDQIKVTGKGVGLVATLENGHIRAKKLDNVPTNAFIKQVVACGESPEAQFGCIEKVADKLGLQVKRA